MVAQVPPEDMNLLRRLGGPEQQYTDMAGDVLLTADPNDGTLHGQLATSWKQTAPNEWEFKLREGVKFHDGTDFDAEAAAWSIEKNTAEGSPARVVRYAPGLTAEAKDKYTLVVHCPTDCPILDRISPQLQFESPTWGKAHPDENWPMGTGPFYLADYKEGEYLLYKKFDQYWGDTGYFDQVKVVWRTEPSVRASMISTGEAQFTQDLTPQDAKTVPKVFTPPTVDYAIIRLRGRGPDGQTDPIWGDKRFRQALAYAIDCDAMVKTLMEDVSKCAAVPFNPTAVGWADAPRFTYDPKKARQLLDEVLGPGKQLDGVKVYARTGDLPKVWAETIMTYWADVGVHATFEFVDGDRRDQLDQPGVGNMPPDVMILPGHTNDLYDASVTLSYLDGCNEERSYAPCNHAFSDKLAQAKTAGGDQRDQLEQELTREFVDSANIIALWQTPAIFGAAANLEWDQPQVARIRPDQMRLAG